MSCFNINPNVIFLLFQRREMDSKFKNVPLYNSWAWVLLGLWLSFAPTPSQAFGIGDMTGGLCHRPVLLRVHW